MGPCESEAAGAVQARPFDGRPLCGLLREALLEVSAKQWWRFPEPSERSEGVSKGALALTVLGPRLRKGRVSRVIPLMPVPAASRRGADRFARARHESRARLHRSGRPRSARSSA